MPPKPEPPQLQAVSALTEKLGQRGGSSSSKGSSKSKPKTKPKGRRSGKYGDMVKGEMIAAIILAALYPFAAKKFHSEDWIKRVAAVWLAFLVLLLVAKFGPKAGRIAAGIGGLILLATMMERDTANGELRTARLLKSITEALQPGHRSDFQEDPLFDGVKWPGQPAVKNRKESQA